LSGDELDYLARGSTECTPDAELAFAPRDLEREQTIQTDTSEHEPDESER
jgi:hypothetical protein